MAGETLLVLHDSPDFGGHERILLTLLPALLDGDRFDEVVFCIPACNDRLRAGLLELAAPRLRIVEWRFVKRRAEPYLASLRWRYAAAVRRLLRDVRPDRVLLVQGRIENLAVPMLTIPGHVRLISYVPMAHGLGAMGRAAFVGDRVRRRLYRRPDAFLVPSAAIRRQIVAAGGRAPVTIVPNVVTPPPKPDKAGARAALGLPEDRTVALVLGRLETVQKGIDRLLAAIRRTGDRMRDVSIVFVGDGPAAQEIRAFASESAADICQIGWSSSPEDYLAAADVLLLPSRWEGVPLVMLEAFAYRIPILSARLDVFEDHLPPGNMIDFEADDLAAAIEAATSAAGVASFRARADEVLAGRSLAASRARFAEGIGRA